MSLGNQRATGPTAQDIHQKVLAALSTCARAGPACAAGRHASELAGKLTMRKTACCTLYTLRHTLCAVWCIGFAACSIRCLYVSCCLRKKANRASTFHDYASRTLQVCPAVDSHCHTCTSADACRSVLVSVDWKLSREPLPFQPEGSSPPIPHPPIAVFRELLLQRPLGSRRFFFAHSGRGWRAPKP